MRKQLFLREYMALQHKALEKGVALPGDLDDLATARTDWPAVTLRLAILSLVLGITGVIIGMFILPGQPWVARDADAPAIFASFWAMGLLLVAFGLGNLICWLVIDRQRAGKTSRDAS
jgi:hypothetical protein